MVCITETWLNKAIPDCACVPDKFRNHRTSSIGDGVCAYINSTIKVRRITEFENDSIESIWISIRPKRLPRSISVILLAVIYHSTSSTAVENSELYKHIQSNVDHFLSKHPDALIIITGEFNPTSTGFNADRIKQLTGLRQIINVPTRENSILDWCLTNRSDLNYEIIQLSPIGASDHNSILIKEHLHCANKPCNERVWKRDMRDSKVRSFGQWITGFEWTDILNTPDCVSKYEKFNDILQHLIQHYFPLKPTSVRKSDKPWVTPLLKLLIRRRHRALHVYGKLSPIFKKWRNKVQAEVKLARDKYYRSSVKKFKDMSPARWWPERN